jgi:hypothetical protein
MFRVRYYVLDKFQLWSGTVSLQDQIIDKFLVTLPSPLWKWFRMISMMSKRGELSFSVGAVAESDETVNWFLLVGLGTSASCRYRYPSETGRHYLSCKNALHLNFVKWAINLSSFIGFNSRIFPKLWYFLSVLLSKGWYQSAKTWVSDIICVSAKLVSTFRDHTQVWILNGYLGKLKPLHR